MRDTRKCLQWEKTRTLRRESWRTSASKSRMSWQKSIKERDREEEQRDSELTVLQKPMEQTFFGSVQHGLMLIHSSRMIKTQECPWICQHWYFQIFSKMAKIRGLGMNNEQGCENTCYVVLSQEVWQYEEGESIVGGTHNAERVFLLLLLMIFVFFKMGES